jgi:hypothetical protein
MLPRVQRSSRLSVLNVTLLKLVPLTSKVLTYGVCLVAMLVKLLDTATLRLTKNLVRLSTHTYIYIYIHAHAFA